MTVAHSGKDLSQKGSHRRDGQTDTILDIIRRLVLVHKGLEIMRHKLKDQIEASGMSLNNVQQLDDIGMVQLPE